MSYVRPVVQVYQEYEAYSTASQTTKLIPCIIGPCYHVIDADDDPLLSLFGELTTSQIGAAALPNNKIGAIVEESSIRIKYHYPVIELAKDIESTGISAYKVTFAADDFPSAISVGCTINIKDGVTILAAGVKVTDVDRVNYTLSINKAVFSTSVSLTVDVYMPLLTDIYVAKTEAGAFAFESNTNPVRLDGTLLTDGLNHTITISAAEGSGLAIYDDTIRTLAVLPIKATINSVDFDIIYSKVYVGYKALRTDLDKVTTLGSYDDITATLGSCNYINPLGLGVNLTYANTAKVPVKCIGVTSNDLEGYTSALDRISHEDQVYSIVPLTQDPGIINMFGEHAYEMSTPEQGQWRVCIANTELPTEKLVLSGMTEIMVNTNAEPNKTTLLHLPENKDVNVGFVQNSISVGDIVTLKYSTTVELNYLVENVITDDLLEVSTEIDDMFSTDGTTYYYEINTPLGQHQQAVYLSEISAAYSSSRVINVWPDTCIVDTEEVPGYFLGCVLAGMIGGLPSHQGFTRMSIAGVTGLKNSGDVFSADELDIIASGGTCVFVQTNPFAVPTIRHQLTTDMSTIEFREISFVKNFDYVSYLSKELLDKYIGKYNITPITLTLLGDALTSLYESLRLAVLPKIGAPILSYTIESIKQVETNRGRIEIVVKILFPYALNEIGLHLVSI